MTDLVVTQVGDTWTNDNKPSENYGSTHRVQVHSGVKRGWLLPELPVIAGRTVLDAYLVGHSAGTDAQTLTLTPVTERWSPGRLKQSTEPTVGGGAVAQAIGALSDGEPFTIPGLAAMLQAVADGDAWYGARLSTSVASLQKFYSTDSGQPAWELHITLSELVDQPTNQRPNGGAVESDEPILAWGSTDVGGDAGQQVDSKVQVDTPAVDVDPDEVTPDYDSGWVANLSQQWSLVGEHTLTGAGPHFWRVMTRDADGTESEWSDWAEFTVDTMPTLVRDSPTGAFGDVTPQFLAHLSDSSTPKAWKAMVTGSDRSQVRAESGMQSGAVDWQVPAKVGGKAVIRENDPGWGYLQVWPEGDWVEAVGALPYREEWFALEFDDDLGVEAAGELSVSQVADGDPRLDWTWTRGEAADAWLIQVDGVTVVRLEPEDVTAVGGEYSWRDSGEVPPLRTHTLSVRAVEADARSEAVSVETSHVVKGLWLLLDDGGEPIALAGTAIGGFSRPDHRATYTTAEGEEVDVFYGMPGRTIPFEGSIDRRVDVWATIDRIEAAKESRTRMARAVWGSQTAYGRLRDPDVTSHDEILPNNLLHVVRFNLYQTGP